MSISFLGVFVLNKIVENSFAAKKSELEIKIEKFLDKKVDLGDYSGIRFLGIVLSNSKIVDKLDKNSEIKVKNTFVGIKPIRSLLNKKWIFDIRPKKTEININNDFFKRKVSKVSPKKVYKNKFKYDLNFNLKQFANLKLRDLGIETRVKGTVIYRSNSNQIIGNINSSFKNKGNLKLKLNTDLNKDSLSLEIFSKGVNLKNYEYRIGNSNFLVKEGNLKSNFKFQKSSKKTFCKGSFSFSELKLNTPNLLETIDGDSIRFKCQGNKLLAKTQNLKYGALNSDFNLNIPLKNNINNINLKASIGFKRLNPEIKFSGNLPYWYDRRGINFGNINSSFNINRTQLSNLNIFRSKGIEGFITAKGRIKGKIFSPDILINFNVDYPHFKGIKIREIWEGEIKNEMDKYFINMNTRYSPNPSFLSFNLNSNFELDDLTISRLFNTNKGSLNIVRNNDRYIWKANNFPLDEVELSVRNNQFGKVGGIINGSGSISKDQSFYDGRLAWSLGKYRNIKLANSLFKFTFRENSFYVDSSLFPVDGGMIDIELESYENNKIYEANFQNISTNWSLFTAFDIFSFDNQSTIAKGDSSVLNAIEINNNDKSFKENISSIQKYLKDKSTLEEEFNLKRNLSKLKGRYNGKIVVEGNSPSNYKLKTNLNGYLGFKNSSNKIEKEEFSIDIEGGFLEGEGLLKFNKLPLKTINTFLNRPIDFVGNLDFNIFYDLDNKSFSSVISSNSTSISDNNIYLKKGSVKFNNYRIEEAKDGKFGSRLLGRIAAEDILNSKNKKIIKKNSKINSLLSKKIEEESIPKVKIIAPFFDLDLSFLLDSKNESINLTGSVPIDRNDDNLNLRLDGKGKLIELIDILAQDYFTFKKGVIIPSFLIKGSINKPITNGFLYIENSEVDIYNNIFKNTF